MRSMRVLRGICSTPGSRVLVNLSMFSLQICDASFVRVDSVQRRPSWFSTLRLTVIRVSIVDSTMERNKVIVDTRPETKGIQVITGTAIQKVQLETLVISVGVLMSVTIITVQLLAMCVGAAMRKVIMLPSVKREMPRTEASSSCLILSNPFLFWILLIHQAVYLRTC